MGFPRDAVAVGAAVALTFRYFMSCRQGRRHGHLAAAFHYTLREPLGVVGCITP
jgi:acyl-CoA reductase-like NAD-dependent aldehyde dehydrogenase